VKEQKKVTGMFGTIGNSVGVAGCRLSIETKYGEKWNNQEFKTAFDKASKGCN
jgi:hypothetical protein